MIGARVRRLGVVAFFAAAPGWIGGVVYAQLGDRIEVDPYLLDDDFTQARHRMVELHLEPSIRNEDVLRAMRTVPRHRFVPEKLQGHAYENRPLPIGWKQTISQPFIVALMTELLDLGPASRVLEVGTGSGYQAAVLAEVAGEVYSIEILEDLAARGARNLRETGYEHVNLRVGDGYLGWPEAAPFHGILVTCAPDHVPGPLEEQLAEGGRLVIPVGERGTQELVVVEKKNGRLVRRDVIPVRFVPMTGPGVEGGPGDGAPGDGASGDGVEGGAGDGPSGDGEAGAGSIPGAPGAPEERVVPAGDPN